MVELHVVLSLWNDSLHNERQNLVTLCYLPDQRKCHPRPEKVLSVTNLIITKFEYTSIGPKSLAFTDPQNV